MENLVFVDAEVSGTSVMLNLGAVAPSSSADSRLRLDNPDDTYQAESVHVSVSGTDAAQLLLSVDGDEFHSSIQIGDITPGGSSPTFWLRRVTPADASGNCVASLVATAGSWSIPADNSSSPNVPLDT